MFMSNYKHRQFIPGPIRRFSSNFRALQSLP